MIFREYNIFRQHGKQFVPDLCAAVLPAIFRGRPVISDAITEKEAVRAASVCPTRAITVNPCTLDMGRCLFCRECEFAVQGKIRFTHDHLIATNHRDALIIRQGVEKSVAWRKELIRPEIPRLFRHALKLRQVSAGGDNSAEMELNAAGNVNFDMGRFGIEFVASPRHADGLVITGPVSHNMAAALKMTWEAMPSPKLIILAGTDAISGGIFAGSPTLDRLFLDDHTVDLYVPGNPPHPLTFINGVLGLMGSQAIGNRE
jgi:Ni,Fe-hydrogenase III small subunit